MPTETVDKAVLARLEDPVYGLNAVLEALSAARGIEDIDLVDFSVESGQYYNTRLDPSQVLASGRRTFPVVTSAVVSFTDQANSHTLFSGLVTVAFQVMLTSSQSQPPDRWGDILNLWMDSFVRVMNDPNAGQLALGLAYGGNISGAASALIVDAENWLSVLNFSIDVLVDL